MSMRLLVTIGLVVLFSACGEQSQGKVAVPGVDGAVKTSAANRAKRRAYDGAPPVIPHQNFGAACLSCHKAGMSVPGVGYAPMVPHDHVEIPGAMSRCRQCHVFAATDQVFRGNDFVGLAQDMRLGSRSHEFAPPVIPHPLLLRENCLACHSGPAAREEIRCSHPERTRCQQCHVPMRTLQEFVR
ncbi:MAG: cytochrome c-type protein NapB [Planctomycetota bacterium]|jgi:cytochrome c-type protein NapB